MSKKSGTINEWVIVRFDNETVKAWRDYGTAWGSTVYTVLDYFTGTYADARKHAKSITMIAAREVEIENACNHEWHSRVSELGADFVSCNRCGADSRRNNEGETR